MSVRHLVFGSAKCFTVGWSGEPQRKVWVNRYRQKPHGSDSVGDGNATEGGIVTEMAKKLRQE